MPHPNSIVFRELPMIEKIIADETWLEGERRGGPVAPDDPQVVERVCAVILRIGAELRASLERSEPGELREFAANGAGSVEHAA